MASNGPKRSASDDVVNCEKAARGVWLVKVPRYLSETWEKNAGSDVGQLVISGKDVIFKSTTPATPLASSTALSDTPTTAQPSKAGASMGIDVQPVGKKKRGPAEVPKEHRFLIRDLNNQVMAILSEDKSHLEEDAQVTSGKLNIEGRVVKRAECQPPNSLAYMKMKISQIEKVSQPKKTVQQMDRAVVKFKPTAVHAENLAKEKAKKDGARTVRAERDVVQQSIFHAFEKHQYYRLSDLQKLTNQPASYVKEILTEIANYNTAPPHKSMWELKPEYRNYSTEVKAQEEQDEED